MGSQTDQDDTDQIDPQPVQRAPAVPDLISVLRRTNGAFAPREQRVADYVMENLEAVSQMVIADLAEACNVSTPTVIRFCRTLGCDGYRDFKIKLARNVAVSMQYLAPSQDPTSSRDNSPVDLVIGALNASLAMMRSQLDQEAFESAVLRLCDSNQILFVGIGGGSSIVAKDAANRFFRLGIPSIFVNDSYLTQMRAATLKRSDTLFLISASGEAQEVVKAAEIANGYGACTICITRPGSRLARISTISIAVDLPEDLDIHKPTASRYAHLVLIDALATAVAQAQPALTNEALRRVRASLTAFHGRIGPQPLGD